MFDFEFFYFHLFSLKMNSYINMFIPCMKLKIFNKSNNILIIWQNKSKVSLFLTQTCK